VWCRCPKDRRRLRTVSDKNGCPVRERISSLVTNSDQWTFRIRLRHQLSNASIFFDNITVTDHVSAPYRTLTLTLIHPTSNWTHWTILRRHPCLSRAATSASSQVNPIFYRSLLTTLLQFALGRPGPLLYPGTCQYSA